MTKHTNICVDCGGPRTYGARERCQACQRALVTKPCPAISHYNAGCRCAACKALSRQKRTEYRRRQGIEPYRDAQQRRRAREQREHFIALGLIQGGQ